ncbi:MAG: MBL fold metallo-hydrolase [Ruminococcus sp.]|nr:MBL fold metallo-hydrolase [Ruminococcus sp.]
MKKLISLISIVLLCCVCLWGCALFPEADSTSQVTTLPISSEDTGLTLHFIDVGQGDCTLIESKGCFALIDAGEYSEANRVVSYLSKEGVTSLEFIISTHPHSDHCGGLSQVIRTFDTGVLISPDADYDSTTWEYVLDAADERGVQHYTPELYDTFQVGAATLTVLSPAPDAVYSNLNNYSIVTMVEYGNTSFMLTGDAETIVEKELIRSSYDLSADVLKCGHHGSSTSTCEAFLQKVNPSAAIISCGKDNDYGHPHQEITDLLREYEIPMWRTDLSGTIIAKSDGKEIYISTASDTSAIEKATNDPSAPAYIGNKNSKVFHLPACGSVSEMSDKNKVNFQSREDAVGAGYKPCGSCDP